MIGLKPVPIELFLGQHKKELFLSLKQLLLFILN